MKSRTRLSNFTFTFRFHWRRKWQPTPVFFPGESQGVYAYILTQNGNPLQCSCLKNLQDGGAWWAAVYGVAQSRTRLKRLSSSSSMAYKWASLVVSGRRICLPMQERWVQSLSWEDPLEEEMAAHSSIRAWENPWTEESGGQQFVGSQKCWTRFRKQTTATNSIQRIFFKKSDIFKSVFLTSQIS